MSSFRDGETIWYSDVPCPECGSKVATNGKRTVCTDCGREAEF